MAPVDRRAERLLPRGRVAAATDEQLQPVLEPVAQRARTEQSQPRRRQLDRKRDAVDAPADVGDVCRDLVRRSETDVGAPRAIHEERDGVVLRHGHNALDGLAAAR